MTIDDDPTSGSSIAPNGRGRRAERPVATIYDVARLAGVSPSTVSRALSKPGRISAKTEKRILAAANDLNYRVNRMARSLPTGRTNTVGLVIADFTNPVFFDIVRGAEQAAAARDYTLVLSESAESEDTELTAAERLLPVVDGLILATSRLTDDQIRELAGTKPVVLVNRRTEDVPSVVPDVEHGIGEAVRHLASLGHSSVAYIPGPVRSWMSGRRWESLQKRCGWANLAAIRVEPQTPTVEGGRRAAAAVRESGVTAALAYNDLMAIGLMQEMGSGGIAVPGELSVVGFDDIFGSDFTTPPLTTIMSPLGDAGRMAIVALLTEVDDQEAAQSPVTDALLTRLIIRGSTGPVSVRSTRRGT